MHKFFNKGRQNEIHVINDVNLELPEKGMVAIFGKSGCGKTTLINLLMRFYDVREGEIRLSGKDIREIPREYAHNPREVLPEPFGSVVKRHLQEWAQGVYYKELAKLMQKRGAA